MNFLKEEIENNELISSLKELGVKIKENTDIDDLIEYGGWFVEGVLSGEIKVKDAIVGVEQEEFVWYDGTWVDGNWINGIWKNGTWLNGTWNGGYIENIVWKNGVREPKILNHNLWKDGVWEDN